MRIKPLLSVSFLSALSFALPAIPLSAQTAPKPGEFMTRFDKDQDGALSKSEVPAGIWERLAKFDKNNDEKVSKEEAAGAIGKGKGKGMQNESGETGRPVGPNERAQFFARMDKNQDGKLVESEVHAQVWERMSRADRDKDGSVSKEELEQAAQFAQSMQGQRGAKGAGPGNANAVLKEFDENTDGKLAKAEVSEAMWAKIAKLDVDSDNAVSLDELDKAFR